MSTSERSIFCETASISGILCSCYVSFWYTSMSSLHSQIILKHVYISRCDHQVLMIVVEFHEKQRFSVKNSSNDFISRTNSHRTGELISCNPLGVGAPIGMKSFT